MLLLICTAYVKEYDVRSGTFSTWQLALFRNIYSQLVRSPFRTFDAAEASLFFIPYDAGVETYIYRDGTFRGGGNPLAKVISKYLNGSKIFKRHDGADHFMIYSASLLSQGLSSKLKRLFRICANVTVFTFETFEKYETKKFKGFSLPYLTAIPYPSIYHWFQPAGERSIPALMDDGSDKKKFLASLLASTQTNQPDSNKFRRFLMNQCIEFDEHKSDLSVKYDHLCWRRDIGSRDNRNNFDVSAISDVYRSSVFCLMPPGDTNTRRGIFDAILCGCIPVLFELPGSKRPVNPMAQYRWHFTEEEIKSAFIYFDGSNTKYFEGLSNISDSEIRKKRIFLRKIAFRAQYSFPTVILNKTNQDSSARDLPKVRDRLDEWSPPKLDGVGVILRKLFEKAKTLH